MGKERRYRPLSDSVLIDPEPDPTYKEATGTRLVIPDAYKYGPIDLPKWGRVLAMGPSCKSTEFAVGDRVLYAKFGWAKLDLGNGSHYAVCREYDVLAVDVSRG